MGRSSAASKNPSDRWGLHPLIIFYRLFFNYSIFILDIDRQSTETYKKDRQHFQQMMICDSGVEMKFDKLLISLIVLVSCMDAVYCMDPLNPAQLGETMNMPLPQNYYIRQSAQE